MKKFLSYVIVLTCMVSCSTGTQRKDPLGTAGGTTVDPDSGQVILPQQKYKKPVTYNFKLIITSKNETADDTQSYYRVFIDKKEIGRTTIGSAAQEKVLESMVDKTQGTVSIEKYVLDVRRGKYVKLRNIDQPKHDPVTVDLGDDRILNMKIEEDQSSKSTVFIPSFEIE